MDESKTVTSGLDLYVSQLNDVEGMKSQIQYFDSSDPSAAKKAIQNITILIQIILILLTEIVEISLN